VKQRFRRARAPVRGTVDGTDFRTTVAVYGNLYYIGFNNELRERAGIAIGDRVQVSLELDRRPRTAEALSYTHRNEYARWIDDPKRDDTRDGRLDKALAMLREGARLP
jgi:hypothetical protein